MSERSACLVYAVVAVVIFLAGLLFVLVTADRKR